jgi:hypothetical protein
VGVSSGSDALLMALMDRGVGPGDEVVTTPFSFFATVGAIVRLGARPVFVDIDPDSFNLNENGALAALTERTKAVIVVHLFGRWSPSDRLLAQCETRRRPSAAKIRAAGARGASVITARSAFSRARTSARSATAACSRCATRLRLSACASCATTV